jgi:hypothetical protein
LIRYAFIIHLAAEDVTDFLTRSGAKGGIPPEKLSKKADCPSFHGPLW